MGLCRSSPGLQIVRRRIPDLTLYLIAINDNATGQFLNAMTNISAILNGGSTRTGQDKFIDDFQRLNDVILGYRASAATTNIYAGLPAGTQNTSAELNATAGDHTAVNATLSVISTDSVHGTKCFHILATGAAPAMNLDITAVVGNVAHHSQRMVKATAGRNIRLSLIGDVTGTTSTDLAATGEWQYITVSKTFADDTLRTVSCSLTDGVAGDVMLCDNIMGAATADLPFISQEATAASATIPTPVIAGSAFSALIIIRRPSALFGSTVYELLNCVASNAGFRLRMENSTMRWERMNGVAGNGILTSTNIPADTLITIAVSSDESCNMRMAINGILAIAGCTPYGAGNDQFNNPNGIACDGTHIYVADYYNHRIVKRDLMLMFDSESPRATTAEGALPATLSLPSSQNDLVLLFMFDGVAWGDEACKYYSHFQAPPPRNRLWY